MRKSQKSKWGIVFERSLKIDNEAHKNKKNHFKIVDIGDFLPHKVKTDMCRVDGTSFMIKRLDGNTVHVDTMLRTKIANLYSWAVREGVPRESVYEEMEKQKVGEGEVRH